LTSERVERPPAADVLDEVSLIIPVFNSRASLPRLFESIAEFRRSSNLKVEIVFVDDGSSDGSVGVLRDLRKHTNDVVVIEHPLNLGQSKATLAGVLAARHDVVVTLDDDLQYRPQDIPRLLGPLKTAGPSMLVMGIADSIKRPLWRTLAGICCNVISNLFLSKPLPLRSTTFCAFHRKLAASIDAGPARDLAWVTELVQAADRTLTVGVPLNPSMQQGSRYTLAALLRLFMSRSRCYKPGRVLLWLAGSLSMTAGSAVVLASRGGPGYAAICLASAIASSFLAMLAISVRRHAR
jgi:glycosyltransferase involved in cell wall biosynthesis